MFDKKSNNPKNEAINYSYIFHQFVLIIEQKFDIIALGTFDVSVVLQSSKRKEVDIDEETSLYN